MSTARHQRRIGLASTILGLACAQVGCCQHYYAQPALGCPPVAAQPSAMRYGSVCEATDGTVVGQTPSRSSTIADSPRPRVVVSEPNGGRLAGRSGWRRTDPEGLATTRVEGALDDETVHR